MSGTPNTNTDSLIRTVISRLQPFMSLELNVNDFYLDKPIDVIGNSVTGYVPGETRCVVDIKHQNPNVLLSIRVYIVRAPSTNVHSVKEDLFGDNNVDTTHRSFHVDMTLSHEHYGSRITSKEVCPAMTLGPRTGPPLLLLAPNAVLLTSGDPILIADPNT